MGLALFGLKKNFFRPEKKEKARPFAQRKDFLRFRVGFCSKKNGNRRKKTSSPLPRSKNRGASPIRQWQHALHSLLQHGSDTSTPDSVRIPQRPTRFAYLNARGSTLRTTLDTGLGCHMRGYRADTRHERSPLCCPRASTSCTGLGLRVCRAESLCETVS